MPKNQPKWKPKKFVMGVDIDIKIGKTTPCKIIQAKTEEEKKLENAFAEKWTEAMKILWGVENSLDLLFWRVGDNIKI